MDRAEFAMLPRDFRNTADFARWSHIRTRGFTEWNAGPPRTGKDWLERHRLNAQARLFPDFYETPTWYVDRCRKMVLAVEPNVWGVLPAGPAPEALPPSQSALPEAQMPLAGRATPLSAGLADSPGLDGFLPGASPSLTGRRIAS